MLASQVGQIKLSIDKFKRVQFKKPCIENIISKLEYVKSFNSDCKDELGGKIELATVIEGDIWMTFSKYNMNVNIGRFITECGMIQNIDWVVLVHHDHSDTSYTQDYSDLFEFKKLVDNFYRKIKFETKLNEDYQVSQAKRSRVK
jgi:hypothetical protein